MKKNKNLWITISRFIGTHQFGLMLILIVILSSVIRLFQLDSYPPSPYWEEVALGFDAYSLLKTGMDHHGHPWPIIAFESFGDWKPSLYFYAIIPFIAILGLSVEAVRMPSALAGTGLVLLIGMLPVLLHKSNLFKSFSSISIEKVKLLGLWMAFITVLEPWAVLFSRASWEANLATFLLVLGVSLWLVSYLALFKKSLIWLIFSAVIFGLAMYTYHSARLIAPLLLIYLEGWRWFSVVLDTSHKDSYQRLFVKSALSFGILVLIVSPLLVSLRNPQVSSRFTTENIFNNITIIETSNQLKDQASNSIIARILFHRYLLYLREIAGNISTYFNLSFLFNSGESNLRHSTGFTGMLFWADIVFLCVGIIILLKRHLRLFLFLFGWLLISLLPAALTSVNPHALRTQPSLPIWIFGLGVGIWTAQAWLIQAINKRLNITKQISKSTIITSLVTCTLISLLFFQFILISYHYITVYSKTSATDWWQYGYRQLYEQLNLLSKEPRYKNLPIYISRERGRPAMYDWFYSKTDPRLVQAAEMNAKKDQSEFLEFANRKYVRDLKEATQLPAIVASSQSAWEDLKKTNQLLDQADRQRIGQITGLDDSVIWQIYLVQ